MSQRLSAAEWIKQKEQARKEMAKMKKTAAQSVRQMPPSEPVMPEDLIPPLTDAELRVGQQMVRNMDEQMGKRLEEHRRQGERIREERSR